MRKRTNPTSESAEAAAESVGRDKDKNNNPDVFSKWSFLAGRASLEAELVDLRRKLQDAYEEIEENDLRSDDL